MKIKKLTSFTLLTSCLMATHVQAFDVVEAGQPVVTGEPSRVGPPWNHRSTFNIPGTNTDVAFGGYVKLDALYDTDFDQGLVTEPFALRNDANRTDGRTTFTAAESRLNFRTQTQTDYGMLRTYVEGHFLPDEKFNLRHAYGEFGGFLAGKTWTNFMDFVGGPRILKLGAPVGYAFERQPQVRYTHQFGANTLSVSLEDSGTPIADPAPVPSESQLPDLTLRYQYQRLFSIAGLVRELETNKHALGSGGDSTTGYGVSAQVAIPLGERLTLKGNTMLGTGLGNYLNVLPEGLEAVQSPDAIVRDGELESVDLQSYGASIEYRWSGDWSSAIGSSYVSQDLPDDIAGFQGSVDNLQYSYANLIWDVNERLATGVELQHSDVDLVSGENRDSSRIQASVQYQF